MYLQTRAFILHSEEYGETDRRVFLYTEKFGKISAVAPGTRKVSSRLSGHLQPPTLCEVNLRLINGKFRIIGAVNEFSFPAIARSSPQLKLALNIAAITDKMLPEPAPDQRLWRILEQNFSLIEKSPEMKLGLSQEIMKKFLTEILSVLGYINPSDNAISLATLKYRARQVMTGMI